MAENSKRTTARMFHHEGKLTEPGQEISVSRARAAELEANGLIHPENYKAPKAGERPEGISMLQHEGRPNDEPEPDTSLGPVSPPPGEGLEKYMQLRSPELTAEPPVDQGETNPEPEADTSLGPVSPPPGDGIPEGFEPEDPALRAASKVFENKAPNDPGATLEDNYAVPKQYLRGVREVRDDPVRTEIAPGVHPSVVDHGARSRNLEEKVEEGNRPPAGEEQATDKPQETNRRGRPAGSKNKR